MTKDKIIAQVDQSFGILQRPRTFIRGTCSCDECMEHEETMQSFALPHLPLDKLGSPSWDPLCFASDNAFAYLIPGLVRLVLNHTENYVSQFLFHLDSPDRVVVLSKEQRRTLLLALDYLFMNETKALDNNMVIDDFIRVREKLEQTI
jgi:hypothetical protein